MADIDYIYAGSKGKEIKANLDILAKAEKRPLVDELDFIVTERMISLGLAQKSSNGSSVVKAEPSAVSRQQSALSETSNSNPQGD